MKGKIVAILICMLMLSTVAGAFSTVDTSTGSLETNTSTESSGDESPSLAYSHDILGEYFTMTTCIPCKYVHAALKNLYTAEYHPFYYITYVYNKGNVSLWRKNELNIVASPTVVWDGDYRRDVGGTSNETEMERFNTSIISCGNRNVEDIDLSLDVDWLGAVNNDPEDGETAVPIEQIMTWTISEMDINVGVTSHETDQYNGHLHVQVAEVNSSWYNDKWGLPYTFDFKQYAYNNDVSISGSGTWSKSINWDSTEYHDYDDPPNYFDHLEQGNTMVIAAIFDEDNNDYVDETVGVRAGIDTDPKTFDVYFGNTTPPPKVVTNSSIMMFLIHDGLNFSETYYWKVDVWNAKGELDSGDIWTFTTRGNDPPNTPDWPDPANGSTTASIDTNLSWSGGDPDGDETTYDVYFGLVTPEHDPPQVAENHTGTTFDPSPYGDNLDFSTLYEWRIVAWDEYGLNTTGDLWHFTTEQNFPPNPAIDPFPEDGDPAVPREGVILKWNGSDPNIGDTLKFDVYFDDVYPPITNPAKKIANNWYNIPYTLTPYTTYYWRIDTYDSEGEFSEGNIWQFSTGENLPPTNPIIGGPSRGLPGEVYDFTFVSTDPNGHKIRYEIKWDDGTEDKTDLYESEQVVTLSHTWSSRGTYEIEARAEDEHGERSGWSKYTFVAPRNRVIYFNLLQWLFEQFPNAFPILRQILGL